MSRRPHLSTKVPNVKLRPAQPGRRQKKESSPLNAMDAEILERAWGGDEDEEISTAGFRTSSKPWRGTIITFTGVVDKATLSHMAVQLGAIVEPALTTSVTHVVAEGYGSQKYNYALENWIPVMKPTWIKEAHSHWIKSDEWDDHELFRGHRLPPFMGLKIAMSGIEPLERRRKLVDLINNNGGHYSKDLDRSCTHLISAKYTAERNQSEKVKWIMKELNQRDANRRQGKQVEGEDMKVVYEEWIWDCVGYEGRWKEDGYDARKTRRTGKCKPEEIIDGTFVRGLPRIAKVEEEEGEKNEPAIMKKRKRDEGFNTLVGDLISSTSRIKVEPTGVAMQEQENIEEDGIGNNDINGSRTEQSGKLGARTTSVPGQLERKSSVLHASRTASFALTAPTIKGKDKDNSIPPELSPPTAGPSKLTSVIPELGVRNKMFTGYKLVHLIADDCTGMENAIKVHGGDLISQEDWKNGTEVDYVIVRLHLPAKPDIEQTTKPYTVVTECWVEGCCYARKLLDPNDQLVFKPLSIETPIQGAQNLRVHFSGFPTDKGIYLRRLARTLGCTISDKLNKRSTHLVTTMSGGEKVAKAKEWGVKVVDEEWLLDIGRSGVIPVEANRVVDGQLNAPSKPCQAGLTVLPNQASLGQSSASSASIPQNRLLKLTPTHIDDPLSPGPRVNSSDPYLPSSSAAAAGGPLSPPKAGTQRMLNGATFPLPTGHNEESIDSKLSRTSSAPAAAESVKEKGKGIGKTVTTGDLDKRREMTEVLRALAEKQDEPPTKSKPLRRNRVPSRLRTSVPYSPLSHTSPHSTSSAMDPSDSGDISRFTPPPTSMIDEDTGEPSTTNSMMFDESIRVSYIDVNAEKERKRLRDAFSSQGKRTRAK